MGQGEGYCLVSEPLNDEVDSWVEIPDGSAVVLGEDGLDLVVFEPGPAHGISAAVRAAI